MKDRVQVNDLAQAQLRPDARGGDTYYRPQEDAVQQKADPMISQLAEGLSKFRPQLMEFAGQYLDKQAKEQTAVGNQAYRDALLKDQDLNQKSFKDLVDQGVIPAGASPWFQKGWREQQLRAMGEQYGRDVTLAWNANGDLKNSDDPGKLNQFLGEQAQAFREKIKASGHEFKPTELTEVLDPVLDHYNHSVGQQQVQFRVSEIEKQVDTNSRVEVANWSKRTDLPLEEKAAGIQAVMDDMFKKGLAGSKSRQIMSEAIIEDAITSKDPERMKLLDVLKTGTTPLSSDPQVRQKMEQASDHIAERQRNDQRWKWAQDEHDYHERVVKPRAEQSYKWSLQQHAWAVDQQNRTEQERTLHSALGDAIRVDPAQDLRKSSEFQKLTRMDPMKAQAMLHFQQVYLGAGEEVKSDDPNSVFQITKDLYTGQDEPSQLRIRAVNAFTHGLMTRGRFEKINEEILQYQEGKQDPILGSQEFHQLTEGVYRGIIRNPENQFGMGAIVASQAAVEFRGWARQWSKDHPGATMSDFRVDAQKRIAEVVSANNSFLDMGKLVPPKEQAVPQGQAQSAAPSNPQPQTMPQQGVKAGPGYTSRASSSVAYTPDQLKQMDRRYLPEVITDLMKDPNDGGYLYSFKQVYGEDKPIGHWLMPLYPPPTEDDLRNLVAHPETYGEFNKKHGPGAADEVWNRIERSRQ